MHFYYSYLPSKISYKKYTKIISLICFIFLLPVIVQGQSYSAACGISSSPTCPTWQYNACWTSANTLNILNNDSGGPSITVAGTTTINNALFISCYDYNSHCSWIVSTDNTYWTPYTPSGCWNSLNPQYGE